MANALVGKASVSITCVAPNNTAAEALRDFFVGHREFMEEKSYQNGPLAWSTIPFQRVLSMSEMTLLGHKENIQKPLAKPFFICTRFMNQQMDCIIIGLNQQSFSQFLGNYAQPIK